MRIAVALTALLGGVSGGQAANCGPDKLGTSRVIEVGVQGGLEVGLKTYPQTIPLADHEVILTFDDGPAARTTPQILSALAKECVRATFFEIGRNAEALPSDRARRGARGRHGRLSYLFPSSADAALHARRRCARGHSQGHDRGREGGLRRRTSAAARRKTSRTSSCTRRSSAFPASPTPKTLRRWLAANNVGVFSVDLWAGDWIKMTPQEELKVW